MNRRQARQVALKTLFQLDVGGACLSDALRFAMEDLPATEADDEGLLFAISLSEAVWKDAATLDLKIEPLLKGWTMDRLPRIDLEILRMGIFEIEHMTTPMNAVINECVELAKEYSTAESGRFVNGVLGMLAKSVDAPDVRG